MKLTHFINHNVWYHCVARDWYHCLCGFLHAFLGFWRS